MTKHELFLSFWIEVLSISKFPHEKLRTGTVMAGNPRKFGATTNRIRFPKRWKEERKWAHSGQQDPKRYYNSLVISTMGIIDEIL